MTEKKEDPPPLAALIAGVRRHRLDHDAGAMLPHENGSWVQYYAILAALEAAEPPEEIGMLKARIESLTADNAALRRELAMGRALPAALEAAPNVNETPKSEHDGADVLTVPALGKTEGHCGEKAPPDLLSEAGKVLEPLSKLADDMDRHATDEWDESELLCRVGDTIRALIALATAQAAQIAGLTKERDKSRKLESAAQGLSEVLDQHETKGPLPDTALMFCWLAAQNVRAVLRGYMLEKTE